MIIIISIILIYSIKKLKISNDNKNMITKIMKNIIKILDL